MAFSRSTTVSLRTYDDRIVGYLAVPFTKAEDILTNGFVCSTRWCNTGETSPPPGRDHAHTARKHVPFSRTRHGAVRALRSRVGEAFQFIKVLELRRFAEDGAEMPYTVREKDIIPGDDCVIDPSFLHSGTFLERGVQDYKDAPCPMCGGDLTEAEAMIPCVRGKVGMSVYVGHAFMVAPCPNPDCIAAQQGRQDRLDECPARTLYHGCSRATANKIKRAGGKFYRGKGGQAGGGIYFAHTPRETWWKAEDPLGGPRLWWERRGDAGWSETDRVVFECRVKMGREYHAPRTAAQLTFKAVCEMEGGPYDSAVLDRGQTGYPDGRVPDPPVIAAARGGLRKATRIEDVDAGRADDLHAGYEFVVYSWDQVEILRELPFAELDPPPRWEL